MSETSNKIQYFEAQKTIYTKHVDGKFRLLKWHILAIAMAFYHGMPWLRFDRGEHAPDQAVLVDMVSGRLYFFFFEIWPQEVYYLTATLIIAAVSLFLVTSLLGRVWCGYFCFQTIWTDLFLLTEQAFQGDRNARMRLDKAPLSFNKVWRKTATHIMWIVISLLTGGAWVFYFNDAPTLLDQILHFDIPWSVGGWILALTGSTYLMAGFAREQVCTYMCPYARFQSAMFDKDTLVIGYNEQLAEPRGHYKKGSSLENRGACIDCSACVQVCPMGIDIRDGLQMECIACGLCIDACDDIMKKVGFDKKLIGYDRLENFETLHKKQIFNLTTFLRPRTYYYIGILIIVFSLSTFSYMTRSDAEMHILHDRNPLFVTLSNGEIRNGYNLKIMNKTHHDKKYKFTIKGLNAKDITLKAHGQIVNEITVFADSVGHYRLFITSTKQTHNRHEFQIELHNIQDHDRLIEETIFISGR